MKGSIRGGLLGVVALGGGLALSELTDTTNIIGLDKFGEGSVRADLTGPELANLFSGPDGTTRYYRYQANDRGEVPASVAFCDVSNSDRPAIIDVASQGASGIYAIAAAQDAMPIEAGGVEFDSEAGTCIANGMTFEAQGYVSEPIEISAHQFMCVVERGASEGDVYSRDPSATVPITITAEFTQAVPELFEADADAIGGCEVLIEVEGGQQQFGRIPAYGPNALTNRL